jgi:phage portal protein BeeE
VKLWRTLIGRGERRYTLDEWAKDAANWFTFNGHTYPIVGLSGMGSTVEEIEHTFQGYVRGAYKRNGVVFAISLARQLLFSEARFQWQPLDKGRPGTLFGNPDLTPLERPWPNGTTGELLGRMEQDATNSGNFFVAREGQRLRRLRPDWVSIVLTAPPDEAVESDVAGYLYRPGGLMSKSEGKLYLPGEVAHWSPIPDPEQQYRGMSWITPVVREIQADGAATDHKAAFFRNGAKPGLVVSLKENVTSDQFKKFIEIMNAAHAGVDQAYKTLYLGGGADVTVAGADLKQLDFKATQGAGETRICAAGGVPPIIVGLSEGLQAATYSNYASARRKFGDHWARPQWRSACAALETVVRRPPGSVRLWYDDRDIAFLREDEKDKAAILKEQMLAIESGVRAGYTPESIVAAVSSGDLTQLAHTGLYSVQLQPAGASSPADPPARESGGDGGQA